ncbi:hypothetical protein BpHYR1_025868 [Brachionus plicatilis]|uniref:RNA-directed DNA polymerase from mobile element jockey-like n=1 Tax=Brachionus plicatilis TaxID=10195 RepID=A0A3M7Q2H1_BRAPC|nr:hypothetical protein BpHYR1_025868 [Brachionus plicatilis]
MVLPSVISCPAQVNLDQNLDKTRKIEVVWTKLKNGENLSLRKKINFKEKPGPTSYATRNIDNTKISAFMINFDISMLNLIYFACLFKKRSSAKIKDFRNLLKLYLSDHLPICTELREPKNLLKNVNISGKENL